MLKAAQVQVPRYARQLRDMFKVRGLRGVRDRIGLKLAQWLTPKTPIMEVRKEDVLAADLSRIPVPQIPEIHPEEPIDLNWVIVPPGPGSGGHTTIFRAINYLEAHGYRNRIYFYDVYGGDHQYFSGNVRSYYGFHGPIGKVEEGMQDAHAVVATAWTTAYPVLNSRCAGKRFYFVQDFEPDFYPAGTFSILADNTYRMGMTAITAGRWLTEKLRAEYEMEADYFEFGCDIGKYHRLPSIRRDGIVFYARPDAARRGLELGLMAIEAFARRRPDVPIHFYGTTMGKLPFRYIDHGKVTPAELNLIYNKCHAGLSLSMTNVSLVPHEMLAAGCIPVVNEAPQNRIVLSNDFVRYVAPNPHALASELEEIIDTADFEALAAEASRSVRAANWNEAGRKIDNIIRRSLVLSNETQIASTTSAPPKASE